MSSFWMWFIRPIAEFLGAVFLLIALFGLFALIDGLHQWWKSEKRIDREREKRKCD